MMHNTRDTSDRGEFVSRAYQYLSSLNYSIPTSTSRTLSFDQIVKVQGAFYWRSSDWLETYLNTADEESWKKSVRFFDLLQEGIDKKRIIVSDADDLSILSEALNLRMYSFPQVIEYYTYTGEFMYLLAFLKETKKSPIVTDTLLSVYKLYVHDVFNVKQYLNDSKDPLEYMNMALEIRAELADFHQDLPESDVLNDVIEPYETIQRLRAKGM